MIFFYIQYKILQNKLLTTLLTNYFTTLQGRYQGEQETMTTPRSLKEHLTKLKLNIQLRKNTYKRFLLMNTTVGFTLNARLTLG